MTSNPRVWTSAGISAGIDMSLAMVEHLWGGELAREVASAMEWRS
jgi:transcriptional regulator GlxA family with amidase domain